MSTIQEGYRLTVISWENDGDNYRTIVKDGLGKEEVHFIIILLSLLKKSNHDGGWGNLYEPDESQLNKLANAILELGDDVVAELTRGFLSKDPAELPYQYTETIQEYTGYSSENFFTRVVERIKVEYIPYDINILDVTEEFCDRRVYSIEIPVTTVRSII